MSTVKLGKGQQPKNPNISDWKPHPVQEPPAVRPEPMRLLCFGMSRTGTMSLYYGLQQLGYKPYHAVEMGLDSPNRSHAKWHALMDRKYKKGEKIVAEDFHPMLWKYTAVSDTPCILFIEELMDAFPDAKILVTKRPIDGWLKSMDASFYEILSWKRWSFLQYYDLKMTRHYIPILKDTLRIWTQGEWYEKEKLPAGWDRHYAHVQAAAKARGREVLEFHASQGWEPLCEFLGNDVPPGDFPYVNEGDFTRDIHYYLSWGAAIEGTVAWMKLFAPVAVVGGAWWFYQSRS